MQNDSGRQRNDFRRMLWVSVGLHAALLVVFMVSPAPSAIAPPSAITVELVAAAPQVSPPPAPPPRARPKPAEVVLPERPREPAKPKPKPKPRPKPRREVVLPPKPKVERDLDDLLAEMREDAGEAPPEPVVETAAAPEPTRGGVQLSPAEAAWQARVKAHLKRTWVVPVDFRDQSLQTYVELSLDARGHLRSEPRLVRSSGNLNYDDGVFDGIRRAEVPFPAPPEAGTWPFVFNSEDY